MNIAGSLNGSIQEAHIIVSLKFDKASSSIKDGEGYPQHFPFQRKNSRKVILVS
jgi:hypothetical protein